jgi:hypothetical protein
MPANKELFISCPASKETVTKYNRYELITVSPHFGQCVVGIYQSIKEAQEEKEFLYQTQPLPLVIYDTIKQERI